MSSTLNLSRFVILFILLGSVPGNVAIIKYLKEKPLGHQTILDTVYRDFFICNFIAIIFHGICISYVNFVGGMPPDHFITSTLAWSTLYFSLLAISEALCSCFMRYLMVVKNNEIHDIDEWSLTLMIRTSSTLPSILITIHYYRQGIQLPLEYYLTTLMRSKEQNPMVNI